MQQGMNVPVVLARQSVMRVESDTPGLYRMMYPTWQCNTLLKQDPLWAAFPLATGQ